MYVRIKLFVIDDEKRLWTSPGLVDMDAVSLRGAFLRRSNPLKDCFAKSARNDTGLEKNSHIA